MLKVSLFGKYVVELEDEPLQLSSRPAETLFAYLLLQRDVVHRRERLAGLIWPDSPESSARKSLRNALWQLRRTIGDAYLIADRNTIAFNTAAPYRLDVAILEGPVDEEEPDALIPVVSVYEGALLPGFYEEWVLLERERLRSLFERRVQNLLDGLVAAGRWKEAQTWAERWIALGHIPEPAYRALMTAYAGGGDLAGMAKSYRRCVETLEEELGVPPSDETVSLYKRLSEGEQPLVSAEPARGEASPTPGAALRSALPAYATPLVGRQEELAEIDALLQPQSECRLLTLVGPGGIGKTRLAVKAASTVEVADGVWFIPLAPVGSGTSLVSAIANVLGLRLDSSADAGQQLLAYLRQRELLLILDNFEHLLSPAKAERSDASMLLTEILKQAPRVKLLVTSRERINLSPEWVFNVEGLQSPPLVEGMAAHQMRSFSAVQLFLQRARQLKRSVGRDPDELADVARICWLVGGMPLALELAAAWVNVLSSHEILQEIERSLSFLQTNQRDYPERHRNMRAVFDTSWKMLSKPERQLFRRLSVFRGGFTRAAAEAVGGEASWTEKDLSLHSDGTLQLGRRQPQVLAALAGLVDKSFVQLASAGRYEIHELLRQYGAAKLLEIPDEEWRARDDHARYHLLLLVHHDSSIKGANQRQIVEQIAPEVENFRAAWNWAVHRGRLDWLARILLHGLWLFEVRNDFEDAAAMTFHAVETFRRKGAPGELTDPAERDDFAFLLSQESWFAFRCGQIERGHALSDEALSLLRQDSQTEYLWYAHELRSWIELALGNLPQARHFIQTALAHSKRLSSPWHRAWSLSILGTIVLGEGEPQAACDRLQESLALWKKVGDPRGLIYVYTQLGAVTLALGQSERALGYAEQCLALSAGDDRWIQANAHRAIGQARTAQGDIEGAERAFRESIALCQEIGDSWGAAQSLVNLGNAALEVRELDQARTTFVEALPLAKQAHAVATGLSTLLGLAQVEAERGRREWAHTLANYVAGHPQASELDRDAAKQMCEELQTDIGEPESTEMAGQFRGREFQEVVDIILDGNQS